VAHVGDMRQGCATRKMISLSRMDLRGFIAIGQGCAVAVVGVAGRSAAGYWGE
jgi:hypothetical protein